AVAVTEVQAKMKVTVGAEIDLTIYTELMQPEPHDSVKRLDLRGPDAATLLLPDDPSCLGFGSFLPAWFALRDKLLDAVVLLCAPFYAASIYSEHLYGTPFKAAEALAKARFESRQRSTAEHAARVEAIIAPARAAGVDTDVLEWATNILRSRNDRPLKELVG